MIRRLDALPADRSARAPVRLALGVSLVAIAFAAASPAFHANPLLGRLLTKATGAFGALGRQLPVSLGHVANAMRRR